jgi:hypothetical protein
MRESSKQLFKFTYCLETDERMRLDRIIRWEVFKQLIKFTYILERMGWDNQMRLKYLTKFTYILRLERNGMIRWDVLKTIDQVHILSGDVWRGWDRMITLEVLETIDLVHVRSGDRGKRWDRMVRRGVFKQQIKFTNILERIGWDNQTRRLKTTDTSSHTF